MFVLTTILLTTLVQYALSCSCGMSHPQNHFCRSSFVIRGTASKVEVVRDDPEYYWSGQRVYEVEVNEVFKKPEGSNITTGSVIKLSSQLSGSMCGTTLQLNEDTLIATNGYSINMCNWIVSYSSLSETEKNGMEGQYDCDCEVKVIYADRLVKIQRSRSIISESSCNYVMKYGKRRSHKLEGICAKDEDSVCKWI